MNVMTLLYLIISLALTLPSCVAIPIQSNIPGQLPNMKAQIVIGESRRGDVRNELGQPFIVHNDVEIYRALKGSEWWVAGIILPTVPFGLDVIAYAMVAYDEDNIVKELEWGIFGTKDWGIYGERSEEITSHIELEVGEFVFLSEKCSVSIKHLKACEYLYLNQIASKDSLYAPVSGQNCLVTIDTGKFVTQVKINEKKVFDASNIHLSGEFFQVELPEGKHILSMDRGPAFDEEERGFECISGDRLYIFPVAHERKTFWGGQTIEIIIDKVPSAAMLEHKKLLYYTGQWIGKE